MDVLKFNARTLHGKDEFHPKLAYGFEDPQVAAFFRDAGWAKDSDEEPDKTFPTGSIKVDPQTRSNETGELVVQNVKVTAKTENK